MTISYRIVELIRKTISNDFLTASDTDVARVLGLGRATVSAYKHDRAVMSPETLQLAQKVLQLPEKDFDELLLALTIEGTREPELRSAWKRLQKTISRSAAAVVAAIVAAAALSGAPSNQAIAAFSNGSNGMLCEVRKRRRRAAWARFFTVFPVAPLAGCAQ